MLTRRFRRAQYSIVLIALVGGCPMRRFLCEKDQQPHMARRCEAAALLGLLLFLVAPTGRADSAFVRVNQLGYEVGTDSRAYLMSTRSENGAAFKVTSSKGVTVFSRTIGAKLGTWGKFAVYALDFEVDNAGAYTIDVSGPVNASSPSFRIGTPKQLYSRGLTHALSFYQNERDGEDFIKTPLRSAAGDLHDKNATVFASPQFDSNDNMLGALKPAGGTIDASGGWWDA